LPENEFMDERYVLNIEAALTSRHLRLTPYADVFLPHCQQSNTLIVDKSETWLQN